MMNSNEVKTMSKENVDVIMSDNYVVIYNKDTQKLTIQTNVDLNITSCNNLEININGDLDINVNGEINILAKNDFAIDSDTIWLNSEMTKQHLNRDFKKWYWKSSDEEKIEYEKILELGAM